MITKLAGVRVASNNIWYIDLIIKGAVLATLTVTRVEGDINDIEGLKDAIHNWIIEKGYEGRVATIEIKL